MPPASRNQRVPRAGATPTPAAASSLERPAAIDTQNWRRSSRRATEGRPGDRNAPRPHRSERRLRGSTATSLVEVLRRPLEPALCAPVEERFGVRYGESGMLKLLEGLDLSWQKTRPVHPEADPKAQERFKKPCPARCGRRRTVTPRRRGSSCGSWTRPASARRAA